MVLTAVLEKTKVKKKQEVKKQKTITVFSEDELFKEVMRLEKKGWIWENTFWST